MGGELVRVSAPGVEGIGAALFSGQLTVLGSSLCILFCGLLSVPCFVVCSLCPFAILPPCFSPYTLDVVLL